jgi:hypothetical protein
MAAAPTSKFNESKMPSIISQDIPIYSPEMARPESELDPNSPTALSRKLTQMQVDMVSYSRFDPPVPPAVKERFINNDELYEVYRTAKYVQIATVAFLIGTAAIFIAKSVAT